MDWEIYDGQLQRGPMPEAGVFDAIRNGLPRNAYVRPKGASEWLPLETHPVFAVALHQRGGLAQWPPPPPPPAYVGSPETMAPVVSRPPPTAAYAVSSPYAGQPTRKKLVSRGCLLQGSGVVLLLGAAGVELSVVGPTVVPASIGLAGVGLLLLLVGGLFNLKWTCGLCRTPIADRSVLVCPSCRASFT